MIRSVFTGLLLSSQTGRRPGPSRRSGWRAALFVQPADSCGRNLRQPNLCAPRCACPPGTRRPSRIARPMADSAPAVAAVSAVSRPLHRVLSTGDGLAIVVGVVIGAGILRTPGLIAGYLGSPWLILAVWVFGALPAALAALVLAELGAMIPAAGGKYAYVRAAYGDAAAAFAGWGEVLLNRSFTGALKAVLIGEYLVLLAGRGSAQVLGAGVAL